MPFPSAKYDVEMTDAIGRACVDRGNVRAVWRDLAAGTFGPYGVQTIPYSTVAHYAQRERRRRRVAEQRSPRRRPDETIGQKTERLAHRVLDLAASRLERYTETGKWSPRDLVEVADMLGKIGKVAPPSIPTIAQPSGDDPLTVALVGRTAENRRSKRAEKRSGQAPQQPAGQAQTNPQRHASTRVGDPGSSDPLAWLGDRVGDRETVSPHT